MDNCPLPRGFRCSGIDAGIKEEIDRKDLGLIVCGNDAVLGAVYTRNKFPSAHVQYCRELTPAANFRALIINSGNANAATGRAGLEANREMVTAVAGKMGIKPEQVFSSSTGIIGRPFPIVTVKKAIDRLFSKLAPDAGDIAEAIMTTDTRKKVASKEVQLRGKSFSVVGFCKGSGMIHPNMGTMLAYILTDLPLSIRNIQDVTESVCNRSFNCVSVDGDTSTNDSFFLISSNPVTYCEQEDETTARNAVLEVAVSLAKQIAADGEGASHLIEVTVRNGLSDQIVHNVLNYIMTSNLVKTAIYGRDPNWGRILMATGNALASSDIKDNSPVSISIQKTPVFIQGEPCSFNEAELSEKMAAFEVYLDIDLHQGNSSITGWACDFSEEYVHINADYST